ncbi:MAG: hypothetical protein ACKV2T_29395, partial [Kofleriaceae bacterium]
MDRASAPALLLATEYRGSRRRCLAMWRVLLVVVVACSPTRVPAPVEHPAPSDASTPPVAATPRTPNAVDISKPIPAKPAPIPVLPAPLGPDPVDDG